MIHVPGGSNNGVSHARSLERKATTWVTRPEKVWGAGIAWLRRLLQRYAPEVTALAAVVAIAIKSQAGAE